MYKNVGGKIKGLGYTITIIGFCVAAVVLVCSFAAGEKAGFIGFVSSLVIALFSWLSNLCLVGFGQLVQNSDRMLKIMEMQTGIKFDDDESDVMAKPEPNPHWSGAGAMADRELDDVIKPDMKIKGDLTKTDSFKSEKRMDYIRTSDDYNEKAKADTSTRVFCQKCGKMNQFKATYCENCGSPMNTGAGGYFK